MSQPEHVGNFEDLMLELATAQLEEQRRAANYLQVLTSVTVGLLVLSVVFGVVSFLLFK